MILLNIYKCSKSGLLVFKDNTWVDRSEYLSKTGKIKGQTATRKGQAKYIYLDEQTKIGLSVQISPLKSYLIPILN